MPHYNCAVVLGATATGKTALAVKLAQVKHGEIISADSRQVYRGLDLGTGKDLQEYGSIPYHLIDVCDLNREFTVFHFQQEVYRIFPQLVEKGTLPIIAGGTGLYLDAILRGYELIPVPEDPALREALATKTLPELQDMPPPYLSRDYMEAEGCWIFFRHERIHVAPASDPANRAIVISKKGEARLVADYRDNPERAREYLQTISDHFIRHGR